MPLKKFLRAAEDIQNSLTKKEKPPKPVDDESNWLISYADMMTLLCVFFVLMFSMSKIEEARFEKVKEAFVKQFGGDYKSPSADFARFVTQIMQENGLEKLTVVKSDPGGVYITFQSAVFFNSGGAELSQSGKDIIAKLIDAVSSRQDVELKQYKIVVEGHTDSVPITSGPYPSNWELSGARASTVVRMFLERGFTPNRLMAIGFADTRPDVPARTPAGTLDPEAMAQNRRVLIRILEPRVDSIPFPEKAEPIKQVAAK